MKVIYSIFLVFIISGPAQAQYIAEIYAGLTIPTVNINEDTGTDYFGYSTGANFGFDLGARLGWQFGLFQFGGVISLGESSMDITIKDEDGASFDTKEANNYGQNTLSGLFAAVSFSQFRFIMEYYNSFQTKMTDAVDIAENPFDSGDEINSKGLGYGLSYYNGSFLIYTVMYRSFWVESMKLRGIEYDQSSGRFAASLYDQFTAQITIKF
jgi:hypothetical protein